MSVAHAVTKRKLGNPLLIAALLAIMTVVTFGCGPSQYTLSISCTPNNGGTVSPGSGIYD